MGAKVDPKECSHVKLACTNHVPHLEMWGGRSAEWVRIFLRVLTSFTSAVLSSHIHRLHSLSGGRNTAPLTGYTP